MQTRKSQNRFVMLGVVVLLSVGSAIEARAASQQAGLSYEEMRVELKESFIPPQPWEIRRALVLLKKDKPEFFQHLLLLRQKNEEQFQVAIKKVIVSQRWKDYYARLAKEPQYKANYSKQMSQLQLLARAYHQATNVVEREKINKAIDEGLQALSTLRQQRREVRLTQLRARIDRLEAKWQAEEELEMTGLLKKQLIEGAAQVHKGKLLLAKP